MDLGRTNRVHRVDCFGGGGPGSLGACAAEAMAAPARFRDADRFRSRLVYGPSVRSSGVSWTLFSAFSELPGLGAFRAPARFALLVLLGVSVFAAFGAQRLLMWTRLSFVLVAILLPLMLSEWYVMGSRVDYPKPSKCRRSTELRSWSMPALWSRCLTTAGCRHGFSAGTIFTSRPLTGARLSTASVERNPQAMLARSATCAHFPVPTTHG